MAKRVFQVAKELGVKSTAVVTKCQAEGLEIKNHMSTLSAGLEATIREWFSEGEHATTVETSTRVDLAKVKTKAPRKRKKKAPSKTAEEAAPVIEAVAVEAPTEEAAAVLKVEAQAVDITAVEAKAEAKAEAKSRKVRKPKRLSPKEVAAEKQKPPRAAGVELKPEEVTEAPGTQPDQEERGPDKAAVVGAPAADAVRAATALGASKYCALMYCWTRKWYFTGMLSRCRRTVSQSRPSYFWP